MVKCIVTGGAGFIGSHLVDRLILENHDVAVIDNLSLGNNDFINLKAIFYNEDITDYNKIRPLFDKVDVVFHLAADPRLQVSIEKPIETNKININGTLNVFQAAKEAGIKKIIFSSSCAVYGDQLLPIHEDMAPVPKSLYGLQKLVGENYARLYCELYGMQIVSLRYFNVYGPRKRMDGAYPMVIPIFLKQKLQGEAMTIVGDGEQTRDYVHVSDVVLANIKAWKSDVSNGTIINIGSGRQTSVNEIAMFIGGDIIHVAGRIGEMRYIEADIKKAKKLLGWEPKIYIEDGIEQLKKTL